MQFDQSERQHRTKQHRTTQNNTESQIRLLHRTDE